jgi:hypothetical protein
MKQILTIIVFTSKRFKYLKELVNDIDNNNYKLKIPIYVIPYNENNTYVGNVKKILNKNYYKVFVEKNNLSIHSKLFKYTQKVKTKFFWWISDDDRIKVNSFSAVIKILRKNKNISGITIGHDSIKEISKNKYFNKNKNFLLRKFNIYSHIHELGMNSTQICSTKNYIESHKNLKNRQYHNIAYSYLNIIYKIIFKKNNWKWLENKLVIYRLGNLDNINSAAALKRLDDEFKGYLIPLKDFNRKIYNILFKRIFYKNILSHIILNFEKNGKIATIKTIKNNFNLIPKVSYLVIIFAFFLTPNFIIKYIIKTKNYFLILMK